MPSICRQYAVAVILFFKRWFTPSPTTSESYAVAVNMVHSRNQRNAGTRERPSKVQAMLIEWQRHRIDSIWEPKLHYLVNIGLLPVGRGSTPVVGSGVNIRVTCLYIDTKKEIVQL